MKSVCNKKMIVVIFAFFAAHSCVLAFDLPVFYRPQLFQPSATKNVSDWHCSLTGQVVYGEADDAFNGGYHRTALLRAYGNADLSRLGVGLDALASKPKTNLYWKSDGAFATPDSLPAGSGQLRCGGSFRSLEYNILLKQNLLWGFFGHVFVPIKDLKLDNITLTNMGPAVVNSVIISDFIANDLPAILQENGIDGNITAPFKKCGLGDIALSVGWHDYKGGMKGIITALGGLMQIGVVVPTGAKTNQDRVFSLPMGYNRQLGVVARGAGEVAIWDLLNIGVQAGVVTLLHDEKNLRMVTDKQQSGWIVLEKGRASVDQGSVWDIGAYAKIDDMIKGLEVIFGYSFVRQERSRLHLEDDVFLSTVVKNALMQDQDAEGRGNRFVSKDAIVNADNRLSAWEMHALHFVIHYDAAQGFNKTWGPIVRFEYTQPLVGKIAWATDVIAGSLGLSLAWSF